MRFNHSFSKADVIRGIHLQKPPYAQGKLVRVVKGSVIDIVVDINPSSPTFGKYDKFQLDDKEHSMVWLPPTMAHGFRTLEDTVFIYKCTEFYNKESESGIVWNDPDLNVDWAIDEPIISEKDALLPSFKEFRELLS